VDFLCIAHRGSQTPNHLCVLSTSHKVTKFVTPCGIASPVAKLETYSVGSMGVIVFQLSHHHSTLADYDYSKVSGEGNHE
jgi:hypothetical protein